MYLCSNTLLLIHCKWTELYSTHLLCWYNFYKLFSTYNISFYILLQFCTLCPGHVIVIIFAITRLMNINGANGYNEQFCLKHLLSQLWWKILGPLKYEITCFSMITKKSDKLVYVAPCMIIMINHIIRITKYPARKLVHRILDSTFEERSGQRFK